MYRLAPKHINLNVVVSQAAEQEKAITAPSFTHCIRLGNLLGV